MTPRTFWTILIKILGIWFIFSAVTFISQLIALLFISINAESGGTLTSYMVSILIIGIFTGFIWLMIFKTNWIIDKLKLDKGFQEEKIELNIHRSTILNIAIIVIGGWMFLDALPLLLKSLFHYYQDRIRLITISSSSNTEWIINYGLRVIIGYLMMVYSRKLVNLIERQRKKN